MVFVRRGTPIYDYAVKAQERRSRLYRPENATEDQGIDLKRNRGRPASIEQITRAVYAKVKVNERTHVSKNQEEKQVFTWPKRSIITLTDLRRAACRYYKISMEEFEGRSRLRTLCLARHVVIWLGRSQFKMSWHHMSRNPERDHTCTIHGYRRIEDLVQKGNGPIITDIRGVWDCLNTDRPLTLPDLGQPDLAAEFPQQESVPGPEIHFVEERSPLSMAYIQTPRVQHHQLDLFAECSSGATRQAGPGFGQLPENLAGFSSVGASD